MEAVSVGSLISDYNLIVPEIQREYVWGNNHNNVLTSFFADIKDGLEAIKPVHQQLQAASKFLSENLSHADAGIQEVLTALIAQIKVEPAELNIGFLYSYRPEYYVFNDRNEDVYLIDGQQRFTTLFLMLFYFAIKEERKSEFLTLFRFDGISEHIAFDYRVRSLTHNFIVDLLSRTDVIDDLIQTTNKKWFLANYQGDPTIRSMIEGLFRTLHQSFLTDDRKYYDFVRDRIKFWHFKTEETSQGEELYITMNSRGQQLADNETLRARLFEPATLKETGKNELYWSEQWEIWQDFFWKRRNRDDANPNADAGFNEFLRWVQIIKMVERERFITLEDDDAPVKSRIIKTIRWAKDEQLNIQYLSLQEIEQYFQSLRYLYETFPSELKEVQKKYKVYNRFSLLEASWLAPLQNNTILQIDLFRLLPILFYHKKLTNKNEKPDVHTLFRLVRFLFNLRLNENISKNTSNSIISALKMVGNLKIDDDITIILDKGTSKSILSNEEEKKLNLYKDNPERIKLEDQFWLAEDVERHNGEIGFLIDWSTTKSSGQFKLLSFTRLMEAYYVVHSNDNKLRGDLMITDAYDRKNDRVTLKDDFFKLAGYLQLVSDWQRVKDQSFEVFLKTRRKAFIKRYPSIEEIQEEKRYKEQLYIYFILSTHLMKRPIWNFQAGPNFGVFSQFQDARSIFNQKYIYQHFHAKFQWNFNRVLLIQREVKIGPKKINDLLTWSQTEL